VKNKSKTQEDDKAFKTADKVFDEYSDSLCSVFSYFSKNGNRMKNGRIDNTIQIEQLFDLLRTSNLLEGKVTDLKLEDIIFLVEKYFDPTCTL